MSIIWEIVGDALRISALATLGIAGILTILIWKENLRSRVTYIRFIIQAVALGVLFYLFSTSIPLLYYLVLFPLTIVLGRLYCGWFCPFGFLMDVTMLLKRVFRRSYRVLSDKLNMRLHQLRYVLFVLLLVLPVFLWLNDPPPNFDFGVLMLRFLSGPFKPYTILIDPMIPYTVPFITPFSFYSINFNYPYAQNIVTYISGNIGQLIAVTFVFLTVAGSFFIKRFWCRFCPTGSSLAVINRFKGFKWAPLIYIDKVKEDCYDCGVCKAVCPMQVKEVCEQKTGKIINSKCILCARCVEGCPAPDALKLKLGKKTLFRSRNSGIKMPKWIKKWLLKA